MNAFLCALGFLTRMPVPRSAREVDARTLRRSVSWFPLVGVLVGTVTATAVWLFSRVLPMHLAVVLAIALEVRLTGAFQERALADSFDAFGGGWSKEEVLRILKHGALGAPGAIALVLALLVRVLATAAIPEERLYTCLIVSAGAARWLVVGMMIGLPQVSGRRALAFEMSEGLGLEAFLVAGIALAPFLVALAVAAPLQVSVAALGCAALYHYGSGYLERRIGGTTGDTLGCAGLLAQLLVLVCVAAQGA